MTGFRNESTEIAGARPAGDYGGCRDFLGVGLMSCVVFRL